MQTFPYTFVSSSIVNDLRMKLMKNHKLNFILAAMLWVVFVVMSSQQVTAQGFEFNFGGLSEDQGAAILQTDDRGYLLAGYTESFGGDGDLDVYIIRTDVDGQRIWEVAHDEGFIEHAYGMDATLDRGYVIVGDIRLTALDSFDVYLFKIDREGAIVWSKNYGSTGFEQGFDVKATSDGGYLIAGRKLNPIDGDLDILVIKTDALGNLVWEKTFGGEGDDEGWNAEEVADGYIIGGNGINPGSGSSDVYVLKLDFNGDFVWDYYFDQPATFEQGFGMTLASDGGYVVAGHSNFTEFFAGKLSADGTTELWTQNFSSGIGGQINDVIETEDGNYVVGGIAELTAANIDLFIAKLDASNNGAPIWTRTYGRTITTDWAESLVERADGGFAIVGWNGQASQIFINDVKLVKADSDGRIRTNYITGKIYADWNNDLSQDAGEQGLNDWVIEASNNNESWYGASDEDGNFYVLVDTGTYDLKVLVKGTNWESAYPFIGNLAFTGTYDTIQVEFPMHKLYTCPTLVVDVTTGEVVNCENSTFTVNYRNEGTADASGVEVSLELDSDWTFVSSSIPGTPVGVNTYAFQVSDLNVGDAGSFEVTLNAACDVPVGTNFFVKAHITPDDICVPAPLWNGSSVELSAACVGDTVVFQLRNIGNTITPELGYIVIEDEIMGKSNPFELPALDIMEVKRYASGGTFRLVAQQTSNHPGRSNPTIAVEGCMASGVTSYSTGMVTMFQEDEANYFVAIDAQESIEANDATILRAYPKGYRGDTIAANVDLEYHVRFENTTEDTLYWIAVRDSLPLEYLDLATIQPGASSHPYNFSAYDNGVVKFVFETIALPPAAKGFVQFKISQQPDLQAGTEIFNSITLFGGYDETPVQSQVKRHVIGGATLQDFVEIIISTRETPIKGVTVTIFPNPMAGQSTIIVEGRTFQQLEMNVFDASGRLVRQEKAAGNQITLEKGDLKAGTYFFTLNADGQQIKTGKVIVQ